ncbi:unnamed protein product [Paramecium sonneborni]|uniref:EGF-like domain-containing protein n=1 Tax=Paramecium sonneborni TaxID=65129 RepID=A0A8S1RJM0_9CILI|nr:unnamed protein product [Paramecium sonneborni]
MSLSIFLILLGFIDAQNKWQIIDSFLYSNQVFSSSTSYFTLPSSTTLAQFITCTTPATSYITLNTTNPSVESKYWNYYKSGTFIVFDLFFQGTWENQAVIFSIDIFSYSFYYTSPTTYPIKSEFCDNLATDFRTINFTLTISTSEKMKFTSTGQGDAQVSIKNIYILRIKCCPSCSQCTGSQFNECTQCYYGNPTNNICPTCPSNQYYMRFWGCKNICDMYSPIYQDGFCQNYPISLIEYDYAYIRSSGNLNWSPIYDPLNIDISPTFQYAVGEFYGIFKFNSGFFYFFNKISNYTFATYLIGLEVVIKTFNDIPLNCGIQFKINNTYYGSIYKNDQGIQTHKFKIYEIFNYGYQQSYSSIKDYQLITYLDIPQLPILFSAIGNYSDNTAGWGIYSVHITSGYCSQFCLICEVSFKCKTCANGFYQFRDGSCIDGCSNSYQKLNGSYCQDYDDETPYSKYLIEEYTNEVTNPEQYAQYNLLSANGTNFLKGSDIYYSYWQSYRVFGGPFVWAQAKFQRIHNIVNPHHSITIGFYIIYGPQFPSDGRFIYTIENNEPVSKSKTNNLPSYLDGSKQDKVYERISHNTNTLMLTWECFGVNNEPIHAYCGFHNYYIAVHYCQPYCLQCQDQNTCTSWNTTYNAAIVRFSQSECQINHYFDRDSFRCLQCLQPCLTCTSKIDCLTCQSTYTLTRIGCVCLMNQYEDQNQCFDCPIECNQCLSPTLCLECLIKNNRQLVNGQCNCINGYYPIVSNPQCQQCHKFCKTCTGPKSSECLTCANIINIQQMGSTCSCPSGFNYQDLIKTCSLCHYSCLTCFRLTIDGCLTCNPTQNRILKGLKCECAPGYYELNNVCTNCPTQVDVSLIQCYKQCNNNQQIWHTNICNTCDSGYQLVSGECRPICGDSQVKGYEQCEDGNNILDDLCYNCQFQCPVQCQICDQSTTLPCPDVCGDGVITGIEQCEDGNNIQYDGCFNCQYQCQLACSKCIKGECFECATPGWFVDPLVIPWQCQEKCGDGLIVGSEQCEDDNSDDTDGCKDCKYYCRIGCSSCDYTNNICLSCESPAFVPYSYYCKNICGDGLVANDPSGFYSEECDDGNTIDADGCNTFCKFQCQPSSICTSCVNNRCELCASEYFLSNNQICIPICGDSIQVPGESCEDGLILPYKGCQNCQPRCQTSCLNCSTSGLGCNQCKIGYNKINYLCYSVCGDKIVTDDEQCDDGNLILGDGCHFCQFSCQDSCLNCIKGFCYDCLDGYVYSNFYNNCLPFCGDGIILENEQCDDNNQIKYDGCFNCQFQCHEMCNVCQDGNCMSCISNYQLIDNKCIVIQEVKEDQYLFEDDKNDKDENYTSLQNNQDSNNLFDSVCRNNECVYSPKPQMQLSYTNYNFNIQQILINFDQKVKLINQQTIQMGLFNTVKLILISRLLEFYNLNQFQQSFNIFQQLLFLSVIYLSKIYEFINFIKQVKFFQSSLTSFITIEDLDVANYNIKLQSIQDFSYDLEQVQYEVAVEILIPLQNKPNLIVSLIQDVVNSNNQTINNTQQSIKLRLPQILSEEMRLYFISTKKSNIAFLIGTISIGFISLLSGESSIYQR